MTTWQRWMQRPQSLGLRKALAQIHLWVGLGVGFYIFVISVSGSSIVFRRELAKKYSRRAVYVAQTSRRLSLQELKQNVLQAYPGYEVYSVYQPESPNRPDEMVLGRSQNRISRLVDPYTGADLGDSRSRVDRIFEWLADLHYNLLSGVTGRMVNGLGALLVVVLSLTGIMIWWPGIKHWRRGVTVRRGTNFPRFNWDLHSAIGFWCFFFVLVWGVSGICLCFPGVFISGPLLYWIDQLHFGRFNWLTQLLWTFLGLAPALLFVTGALIWWNRVLRKIFVKPAFR